MKLKGLIEKRAEAKAKIDAILEKATTENRALTEEENQAFDDLEKEIEALDDTIEKSKKAAEMKDGETITTKSSEEKVEEKEARAFTAYVLGKAEELRASGGITEGANGGIVPTTIANKIITAVNDRVPYLKLATVVQTNGKYSIPVYTEDEANKITAQYVDEGQKLTDNAGKFTTIDLNGFVIGALALISNKLKNNTDINITDFIISQVVDAIVGKLNREFTVGTDSKIKGVLSAKKVIQAKATLAFTDDEIRAIKRTLKQKFRDKGVWNMHPDTYTAILELKDNEGRPYFTDEKNELLGRPVIENDDMPKIAPGAKIIAFHDLKSAYHIKMTKKVEVQVLREKYADQHMTGVIAFGEYDAAVQDEQAIVVFQMAE